MYKLLLLAVIVMICGCSSIDSSMMETAETLRPGSIRAGSYMASSLNAHNLLKLEKKYEATQDEDRNNKRSTADLGIRVSVGLSEKMELVGIMGGITNQKLALKVRMPIEDSTLIMSLMPTINKFWGDYSYNSLNFGKSTDPIKETYSSQGYEMPLLLSRKLSKHNSTTLTIRPAYYSVNYNYVSQPTDKDGRPVNHRGTTDIFVLGLAVNVQFASRYFYLTPTFGIDLVNVPGEYQGILPAISLGSGFQINPQGLFK